MTEAVYKRCTKCGETKPATNEYFALAANQKDGLRCQCKECGNAYYHATKEQARARAASKPYEVKATKRCTKCGEEKPATLEFFYRHSQSKDGLISQCKACKKISDAVNNAAWRAKHPEKAKARFNTWYAANADRVKAYSAKYRTEHKDVKRAKDAAYRANNKDRVKANGAAYYIANKDRIRKRGAAYEAANRDKFRVYGATYRKAHPERTRAQRAAYAAKHPEQIALKNHRRRAYKRSLPATFTTADWQRCLEYFGYCCAVCGRPRGLWHTLAQDHWVPVARDGAYTPDNIVPLCHGTDGCNNSKHIHEPHEWLMRKFGARKAARIERRINEYFDHVAIHQEVNHE